MSVLMPSTSRRDDFEIWLYLSGVADDEIPIGKVCGTGKRFPSWCMGFLTEELSAGIFDPGKGLILLRVQHPPTYAAVSTRTDCARA